MPTKNLTFGLELEMAERSTEAERIIENRHFRYHYDATVEDSNGRTGNAGELVTKPIVVKANVPEGENTLFDLDMTAANSVIEDLCLCAGKVNKSCGLHVHLGNPVNPVRGSSIPRSQWSEEQTRTMLIIGIMLENKMFNLCPPSRVSNRFCRKIADLYSMENLRSPDPIGPTVARKYGNDKRYCWLNLIETKRQGRDDLQEGRAESPATGTFEIRMLGNTKRYEYIAAWTKFWLKIAGFVAWYPSSVAIMNCAIGEGIRQELEAIKTAKEIPSNRRGDQFSASLPVESILTRN